MNAKKKSIMIVDDQNDILGVLSRPLKAKGYTIAAFSDPRVAIEFFRNNAEFDLIISDIRMPTMTGFEFVRQAREVKSSVKIVLMTAFEMSRKEFESVLPSTKIDGLVQKPILPSILVGQIEKIFEN